MDPPTRPRRRWAARIDPRRLVALGRRTRQVVVLAATVGVLTGAGVALFEFLTRHVIFEHLRHAPAAVQVAAPLVSLLAVAAILRLAGPGATPSTADEFIKTSTTRAAGCTCVPFRRGSSPAW